MQVACALASPRLDLAKAAAPTMQSSLQLLQRAVSSGLGFHPAPWHSGQGGGGRDAALVPLLVLNAQWLQCLHVPHFFTGRCPPYTHVYTNRP